MKSSEGNLKSHLYRLYVLRYEQCVDCVAPDLVETEEYVEEFPEGRRASGPDPSSIEERGLGSVGIVEKSEGWRKCA